MKITIKLIMLFVLHTNNIASAQSMISGRVVNEKNKPIVGAKIFIDSLDTNVVTNKEGFYNINKPEKIKTVSVFSKKHGWISNDYSFENKMDFMFLEIKKPKKESSIGQTIEKEKNTVVYRTIFDMIRGRISGVVVQQDNTIIIRGINSIKNNSEPLFVVDGNVVSSIDYLVPNDVKSIAVLKDADASIYGSRGSSGVLLITTKN